jgi:hypothetical protein
MSSSAAFFHAHRAASSLTLIVIFLGTIPT